MLTLVLALVSGCLFFAGAILLAHWAEANPRKRWWGFIPELVVLGCCFWMFVEILSGS